MIKKAKLNIKCLDKNINKTNDSFTYLLLKFFSTLSAIAKFAIAFTQI